MSQRARLSNRRRTQVRQAIPGRVLLPLQPSLLDGWDDRADRQCGLLLHAVHRTGSQGRGGLWVIKMRFVLADAYGGLEDLGQDDQHVDKRNAYAEAGNVIEATTTSLIDLLNQMEAPTIIDYLSIDTEGSELTILEGLDWSRYQFRCITVEHNFSKQRQAIQMILNAQGYEHQEARWDDWFFKQDI